MFYLAAFIATFAAPILLRVVYLKLFLTSVFLNIRSAMTFWVSTAIILLTVHLNTYALNESKLTAGPSTRFCLQTTATLSFTFGDGQSSPMPLLDTSLRQFTMH